MQRTVFSTNYRLCGGKQFTHILAYMGFKAVQSTATLPIKNKMRKKEALGYCKATEFTLSFISKFVSAVLFFDSTEFNAYQDSKWLEITLTCNGKCRFEVFPSQNRFSNQFVGLIGLVNSIPNDIRGWIGAGFVLHKISIDSPRASTPNIGIVVIVSSHSTTSSNGLIEPCMHSHGP